MKSIDQGNNWSCLKLSYPFKDVFFINRNKGFAVGGNTEMHNPYGDALKTSDGGKSWNFIFSGYCGIMNCNFVNDLNGFIRLGRYYLPKSENIAIKILNSAGQEIEIITKGFVHAGEHHLQWSLKDRPAGVYFCKLEAGKHSQIIKLVFYK